MKEKDFLSYLFAEIFSINMYDGSHLVSFNNGVLVK